MAAIVLSGLRGSIAAGAVMLAIIAVFVAAGIGLMALAWRAPRKAREAREREARHPDAPWLWREDWEQGFARADGPSSARFRMTPAPGVLGGRLRGTVETNAPSTSAGKMAMVLNCVLWRRGVRGGTSQLLWQEESSANLSPEASGGSAVVDLEIPFDVRASGQYGDVERVFWRLTAGHAEGGFRASFTVPVFQTAESDPRHTREWLEAQAGRKLGGYSPAPRRIERALVPEGVSYHFPRARNRAPATLATIFEPVFLGLGLLAGWYLWEQTSIGAGMAMLLAGGVGLILLLAST